MTTWTFSESAVRALRNRAKLCRLRPTTEHLAVKYELLAYERETILNSPPDMFADDVDEAMREYLREWREQR